MTVSQKTTTFRKVSCALAVFAIASLAPQISFAENVGPLINTKKPKLTAGQFIANCQTIGGDVSDGGSSGNGGRIVNCEKDNGLGVSCSFDANRPTTCVGTGPRPE